MTSASDAQSSSGRQRLTGAERAAFRAYVRAHHPDVGGDPEAFAAGLDRWRTQCRTSTRRSTVDRFGGPVVFVVRPTGFRGVVHGIRERRARRKRGSRVR